MDGETQGTLLPTISNLLRQVGALEPRTVDFAAVSRQPVFATDLWRRSIAEFLRWSGSTLDVTRGASVFELILCHGKSGAIALLRAFREHLIERSGSFEDANARLEAPRAIVGMAAHWLRLIDWDAEESEGLSPADFQARARDRWTVELPAELAERLKNAAYWTPGSLPITSLIERLVAGKVVELEKAHGGPFPPRLGGERPAEPGRPVPVQRPAPAPETAERTLRNFWKKSPEKRADAGPSPSSPERPGSPQKQY